MSDNKFTDEEFRKLQQSLADLASAVNNGSRSFGPYADAQNAAAAETDSSKEKVKAALKDFASQLGHTAVDFTKSMASGGEGTAKYGTAVSGTTDAIGNLASKLGVFGAVVGGIIKIFGGLAAASLKQNDQLMKSYRELSDMGSVSGSLEQLQTDLNKVGLTTEEYEKFGKMLKGITPELSSFGGSVTSGKNKLLDVVQGMLGVGNQTEIAMGRIGYGADEMRDSTASYVAQQTRLGLAQGKSTEQLRGESVKYMISLRELGELTGLQRDEAQKLLDQQQQDARWAMTLRRIQLEEGDEAMMRAKNGMAAFEATFGKEAAGDLMEQVANKGAIVGEASARGFQATMGASGKAFEDVIKGRADNEQLLSRTAKGVRDNMDRLGPSMMVMGQGANSFMGSSQMMTKSMELEGKKREDIQGNLNKTMADGGKRLNENIDIEQRNRAMRIAADNALMAVGNVTVGMFQKLNEIMLTFAKTVAKMVDWVNATIFRNKTNYADQFKDKMDYQGDVNVAKNALAESERQKAELQRDVSKYTQDASGKTLQAAIDAAKKGAKDNFYYKNAETGEETGDAGAAAIYEAEVKRLEELKKQITKQDGTIDAQKVQLVEKDKLAILEKKILDEKQKLVEREKQLTGFEGGAGAGAQGPVAGSPGYIAKYAPGQASGYGETKAMPSVKSREETLGTAKLEDIIKFTGGTGDKAHFESLDPNVANAFVAMAKEYFDSTGKQLQVNSAFRTPEEQANVNSGNNPKAAPGKSLHNVGKALDINSDQVKSLLSSGALEKYGFKPLDGDPPHIQYGARDGGIFDGPSTGYPVMLHGNEAVIPMPNLEEFTESVKKEALGAGKDADLDKVITKSESSSGDTGGMELLAEMLTGKFEDMINQLESANDTLKNLLTYAKA